MASAGEEILEVIRNHRCGIRGAETADQWPEFQALVERIKANEDSCLEETIDRIAATEVSAADMFDWAKLSEVRRAGTY